MTRTARLGLLLGGLAAATAAIAALGIDTARSELTATFRQMNVPIEGRFRSFRGTVAFDPARPDAAAARLEVSTASFGIGAPEYDGEIRGKAWLDAAAHPQARFVSQSVRAAGGDRYVAQGTLDLKGRSVPIQVPFTVRTQEGRRIFEGAFPISRKAFGIGDPAWDDVLEDEVVVKFRIVTPIP